MNDLSWLNEFTLIRPELLWLLVPWALLVVAQFFKHQGQQQTTLIAPHLAAIVLEGEQQSQHSQSHWLLNSFLLVAIFAAAGPSLEQQKVPVFQAKQARVLVFDMSYSMYATDIAPNRLTQARYKLMDMVEQFKEGDTALVAYAGDAFTISPLTNDAATLKNLIPSLSPQIMPSRGANVIAGIASAKELLKQASYLQGDIILVTDEVEQDELADIKAQLADTQYRLNVYAIGTEQGAPISLPEGGFLKDSVGQIVMPKVNMARLKSLATNNGGDFARYTTGPEDISHFKPRLQVEALSETQQSDVLWRVDAGHFLLVLLLPLALWLFRRGVLSVVVLVVMVSTPPPSFAFELPSWLQNTDQQALSAYQKGDYAAAQQAQLNELKGAALYQQGQFDKAAELFKTAQTADGRYNYANALAKQGKLDDAIAAYDEALKLNPELQVAKDNKAIVEQLKQQQEQQSQEQSQSEQQGDKSQQGDQQQHGQNQQNKGEQEGQQQAGDKSSSEQQQSQQQDDQAGQNAAENNEQQSQTGEQQEQSEQNAGSSGEQNNQPDMQAAPKQPQAASEPSAADEKPDAEPQPALAQPQGEPQNGEQPQPADVASAEARPLTPEEREKAQQIKQLLRKVPDDPAILLRNKMLLEAQQRGQQRYPRGVEKSW
ncbi:VWA domain-containing protein [Pseudoalteromonas fenneropenaei]|uniref:VWA domain-containing protein n=1 Tax=Pseudoalteromonas fenneropenaei TaxID=1737459 RepID=A0ABV7CMZ5_9GAMM